MTHKKIKKLRILFSHFQVKLLSAFLFCTLIPLSIIGCISYTVSYSIARDKIMDSAILAADQLHVQLNSRIRQAENVADTIQYHMYALENTDKKELASYLESLTSVRNNISLYISTFDFYHICIFLKDEQLGSGEGLFFYPLDSIEKFGLHADDLSNLGSTSRWVYSPDVKLPYVLNPSGQPANTLLCCRAMHNQGSGQLDYAYLILMDSAQLSEMLTSSFSSTEINSFLLSPDGYVAASSGQVQEGALLDNAELDLVVSAADSQFEREQAYCYVLSLENGWYQVTEIPKSYIAGGTAVLLRTILITLLLSLPLTILIVLPISRNLSRRIRLLSDSMKDFRLNQDVATTRPLTIPRPDEPDYYDEIDQLGLTFEQLQKTIQQNVSSILDLSLAEERLKYQLLQSQINPHFLYNILGSIRTCQSLGKLDIASQMITDLTRFYRLTLRKSGELISIRDELEIATLYLNMEKLCHNNTLNWEISLEDGIENFRICKFTLQPFLENSILHGISARTSDLFIRISAVYGDDTVIISIEDNGIGIPEDKLLELRQNLEHKTVSYEKHFGICNVNARISSELYGSGRLTIDSEPYRGTRITIEFLQMEGDFES